MTKILSAQVLDVRFPTSHHLDGSDAMYLDPDYSAAYLILQTDHPDGLEGHSLVFTIGRGNDICVHAIKSYLSYVIGKDLEAFIDDMANFWRLICGDSQLRWLGPEKGIIYMAAGAIINAVWDLYAKLEKKPLWKLLADMTPQQLVACVDFTYIEDALKPEEAIELLQEKQASKNDRISLLEQQGYPAYTTSIGWMGYSDEKIIRLCRESMANGWNAFKMKVGTDETDDMRRAGLLREMIGESGLLMMDANQVWGVEETIERMEKFKKFQPFWIEEPTSPDDILGHAAIKKHVNPIKVATGEVCANRVIFKQFFQAKAIDICQVDTVRMAGVNEVLAVLLLAHKFEVPVCPHAGGVGLCELAQHIGMIDYISISGTMENRMIEYVDHLHEHFIHPVKIVNGRYMPPTAAGYNIELKKSSLSNYLFNSENS
ncbi:MAG: fuconate dehydratase [Saprospiraceae bacterium]|nr:fuconate dehydratase [Saprospiraceae bacterium]